jgi:integrase
LQKGRSKARETEPVPPVEVAIVEKTLPHLPTHLQAAVQFQMYTGARPSEALALRLLELDRTGPVWFFRPGKHKTAWHGKDRVVAIGPRAQAVLVDFIKVCCPTCGNVGRPMRACTAPGYDAAVARACEKAGVDPWCPNQLRHTHGTAVRRLFGLEAAQVALGHSKADVTQVYAERDLALAERVAREIG